jgi:hypothetical protein
MQGTKARDSEHASEYSRWGLGPAYHEGTSSHWLEASGMTEGKGNQIWLRDWELINNSLRMVQSPYAD